MKKEVGNLGTLFIHAHRREDVGIAQRFLQDRTQLRLGVRLVILMRIIISIILLFYFFQVNSMRVFGCSLAITYGSPTNFELVQKTSDIFVVYWHGQPTADHPYYVVKVLKGDIEPDRPDLWPKEFARSHTDDKLLYRDISWDASHDAACQKLHQQDKYYILFRDRDADGTLRDYGELLVRTDEIYEGPSSLWGRAVDLYIDIQAQTQDPFKQTAILEKYFSDFSQPHKTRIEQLIGLDIAAHLTTITPFKPTELLLSFYEQSGENGDIEFGIQRPISDGQWNNYWASGGKASREIERGSPKIAGYVEDYYHFDWNGPPVPIFVGNDYTRKSHILHALGYGHHIDAKYLFDDLMSKPKPTLYEISEALEFYANTGAVEKAVETVRTHNIRMLTTGSHEVTVHYANGLLELMKIRQEAQTNNKVCRLAGRCLELTEHQKEELEPLALYWLALEHILADRHGGQRYGLPSQEFLGLRYPDDVRSEAGLALILAQKGDQDIIEWAKKEITKYTQQPLHSLGYFESYRIREAIKLPVRIVLSAFQDNRDEQFISVLCENDLTRRTTHRIFNRDQAEWSSSRRYFYANPCQE